MENKEILEEKKPEIKEASIDKEVIDILKVTDTDIAKVLNNDKLSKRMVLNCFCELLSEIGSLRKEIENLYQLLSVCSAEKVTGFFKELQKNVSQEATRQNVKAKIEKSHQKPKKSSKKPANVVTFSKNDVE